MEACEGCPLRMRGRVRCVGSRGDPTAPLAIIGEAPGAQELGRGVPFIGPSGELLDRVLKKVGFELGTAGAFLTNAMTCRPPKGVIPPAFVHACSSRLQDELALGSRAVLLLLGNSALHSVTGNDKLKITNERGRVIDTPYGPAVPTFHPAAVLRQHGQYQYLLDDVRYAVSILQGTEPKSPGEVRYAVATTPSSARRLVRGLRKQPVIAVDIETSSFNPRTGKILCVGLSWKKNRAAIVPGELAYRELGPLFADEQPDFVWHNGKFDTSFLNNHGVPAHVDQDTMLMAYCLNENGSHGLKDLAADHLGAKDWKSVIKQYVPKMTDSFENIPTPTLYRYLAEDADNTFQLYSALRPLLDAQQGPAWAYKRILLPATAFLREVEQHGMWVDKDRVAQTRAELLADVEAGEQLMVNTVGRLFNPGSPKQVLPILREMGMRVKGTDKHELEPFKERSEFVRTLLAWRSNRKYIGTYCDGIVQRLDDEGRVHSTFVLNGPVNGRLSSRDPNMQNIPGTIDGGRIKRNFGAPPGRVVIELDYSQAELRSLALLSGDKFLTGVYQAGRDLHDEMSVQFFGPNFTDRQRFMVKTVNFGIPYGRGPENVAGVLKISERQAAQLIDQWFARAPEAAAFLQECRDAVIKRGWVQTAFGRRRRFPLVTAETLKHLQNEAANHPIAGTSSDLLLISAMRMRDWLAEHDAFVVNLVHDSIIIECPEELALEVARYGKQIMESTPVLYLKSAVPFKADVKIGQYWGDAKHVDIELVAA